MNLSERVARRFVAELLTKQWLMGIRRGWLSLLSPTVQGWPDVFKAFDQLLEFLDNLRDQVLYVRKAPALVLTDYQKENKEKIHELMEKLTKELKEHRSGAEHWFRVATETDLGRGTFKKEEGEHMLSVYQTSFSGSLNVQIKTKVNPTKGQWNSTRPGSITEVFDKLLELLREQAQIVNKDRDLTPEVSEETEREWGQPSFKEFDIGGMKIVVTDPKFHGKLIDRYVPWIDKAHQLLSRKGFKKVWYGVMFLESDSYEELSEAEQEAYSALGYKDLRNRAGKYHDGEDIFYLSQPPGRHVFHSIVHELGHRYWFKVMSSSQRARFESLVKVHPEKKLPNLATPARPLERHVLDKAIAKVEELGKEIEKAVRKFERSKGGYRKDLDESMYLVKSVRDFNDAIYEVRSTVGPDWSDPHEQERWKALLALGEQVNKFMFNVDDIKGKMDAMPEHEALSYGTPNTWQAVYEKKLRPEWVAQARHHVAKLVNEVKTYLKESFETHNELAMKEKTEYEAAAGPGEPVDEEGFARSDTRAILPVSQYGRSHIREAFAEAFTFYVMGEDMTRDQLESFRSVLSSRTIARPALRRSPGDRAARQESE